MSLGTILLIILILILIGAVRLGRTAPAGAIIPPGDRAHPDHRPYSRFAGTTLDGFNRPAEDRSVAWSGLGGVGLGFAGVIAAPPGGAGDQSQGLEKAGTLRIRNGPGFAPAATVQSS